MRHNVAHRKLGRVTEHRLALLRNQAIALLRHERIETTMPKAKELRPFVERLITIAKRGVAARRRRRASRCTRGVSCSPSFPTRTSSASCSRRWRRGSRIGRAATRASCAWASAAATAAEVAQIELVGSEYNPPADGKKTAEGEDAPKKAKGVGDRLKQAAQRIRGKGEGGSKAQAGGQTRGKAQKSPRRRAKPAGRSNSRAQLQADKHKARTESAGPFVCTAAVLPPSNVARGQTLPPTS